ncbi:MAG: CinA family protein [Bacteroidales bacterium]|nr:CinA family protein [Bacteroidales bacterium]
MERFIDDNKSGIEIGELLKAKGLTMATAESCTGGTIASMVTAIAGSSNYFLGGIVSYATQVKEEVLGVVLHDGVVSEDTALQMAQGAARVCGADCAVATTGVAGPGPSDGHPQGTVCVAVVLQNPTSHEIEQQQSMTLHLEGDREAVILQAADAALRLLKQLLTSNC